MAIKSTVSSVTVPSTSYSKQTENRTYRIVITTPKATNAGINAANDTARFLVESMREIIEYRDGVEYSRTTAPFNPTMAQILAHPDGPTVLALMPKILDDLKGP